MSIILELFAQNSGKKPQDLKNDKCAVILPNELFFLNKSGQHGSVFRHMF